jgi:hypothetical protein
LERSFQDLETDPNLAGKSFLQLLGFLRKVILQDAAILFSNELSIFQAEVFQCNEFQTFRQDLLRSLENITFPSQIAIQQVAPMISNSIDHLSNTLVQLQQDFKTLLNGTRDANFHRDEFQRKWDANWDNVINTNV